MFFFTPFSFRAFSIDSERALSQVQLVQSTDRYVQYVWPIHDNSLQAAPGRDMPSLTSIPPDV
jgi:hypothetical protein